VEKRTPRKNEAAEAAFDEEEGLVSRTPHPILLSLPTKAGKKQRNRRRARRRHGQLELESPDASLHYCINFGATIFRIKVWSILPPFQGIRRPHFACFFFDQNLFKIYKECWYKISIIEKYISIQIDTNFTQYNKVLVALFIRSKFALERV
jgi:hypothetical protein